MIKSVYPIILSNDRGILMYTNEELIKKFKKFIRAEMEAIFFYLDNIEDCNYEQNKEAIDIQLYVRLQNQSTTQSAKDLFHYLILEEEEHMRLIQKEYDKFKNFS